MTYLEFHNKLTYHAEEDFADFQRALIFTDREILGVRTAKLRAMAKELKGDLPTLFAFPDVYYETVFIKLAAVGLLPFHEFVLHVEECVALMDNWSLCDTFKPQCLKTHQREFLPYLEKLFLSGKEYYVRYVFICLMSFYLREEYFPLIWQYIERADTSPYYVHMGVAWLVAEMLAKAYEEGLALLQSGILDRKTRNKAIQKATESYRLTRKQKEYLRSLKIK